MPIENFSFQKFDVLSHKKYPLISINIINPSTNQSQKTWGLIDTGADFCCFPVRYAHLIALDFKKSTNRTMKTANGNTVIHIMKTQLEILHPDSGDILYDIGVFPAHFAPNLNVVLLGEKYFLEKFILKVDYSNQVFSLKLHPQKQ